MLYMKYLDTFLRIVDFKKTSTYIPSPLPLPPPKKILDHWLRLSLLLHHLKDGLMIESFTLAVSMLFPIPFLYLIKKTF